MMFLQEMFPEAVQTDEGLRMVYEEPGWDPVTIDMSMAEDQEIVFRFTMPVKVKSNACAATQSYLDQIRKKSDGNMTRAELITQGRSQLCVMETRMKQTAETEAVIDFVDRCAGFFVTLTIWFKWLEKKAADR